MTELFCFDKSVFDALPASERSIYKSLLGTVIMPAGRPFFLGDDGLPDPHLEGFCNYLIGPSRGSRNTWRAYANEVNVYMRFMQVQGKSWKQATKTDLDLYYMARVTEEFQNSRPLKPNSWNVAATAIVHLYEYSLDERIIDELPFSYRNSRSKFGGKSTLTANILAVVTPEPINFISITNYKSLWLPLLADRKNSSRNVALTDLLLSAGLRISEALGLHTYQIPDPDNIIYAGRKSVTISIVGKGGKVRLVRIPKRIIRKIRFYMDEERKEALELFRKRNPKAKSDPTNVFLSQNGNPLSKRAVESFFKKISKITGIRLTPHGCRHTFAIYQLDAMIKRLAANLKKLRESGADAYRQILDDPLRILQKLLGHSWITSTYIYLDFLEEAEALVDESLADWVDWGNWNGQE